MGSSTADTYRDSHTAPGKGSAYDSHFEHRHRAMLWLREQAILDEIVRTHLQEGAFDHLDFACGTGRIVAHLEHRARSATGVDVSDTMLAEAGKKVGRASLIKADITQEEPFGDRRFDLITAFRFFPNAEDSLRNEAACAIARLLEDDGCFVFNNHKNRYSITGLVMRLYCRLRGAHFRTMTLAQMRELARRAGLDIVETHHTGVLPGYEWLMFAPRSWYLAAEAVLSRVGWLKHVALVQVVVCKRRRAGDD